MDIQKLSQDADVKMPSGKYSGKSIEDVPNGYLEWLIDELDDEKSAIMVSEINKELIFRKKFDIELM